MRRTASVPTLTACLALCLAVPACTDDAPPTAPAAAEARAQIVAMEARKWDTLFGSRAQRDTAMSWYASDFVNVGDSPAGVVRSGKAEMASVVATFPQLPAGIFTITALQVMELGDGSVLVSYKVSGPGPTGAPWSAYVVSIWAQRDGQWKTVFYQASPGAG